MIGTLEKSILPVIKFLIGMSPVICGYTFAGPVLFWEAQHFVDLKTTFQTLYAIWLGDSMYPIGNEMVNASQWAYLYFYTYKIIFFFLFTFIILSIIESNYLMLMEQYDKNKGFIQKNLAETGKENKQNRMSELLQNKKLIKQETMKPQMTIQKQSSLHTFNKLVFSTENPIKASVAGTGISMTAEERAQKRRYRFKKYLKKIKIKCHKADTLAKANEDLWNYWQQFVIKHLQDAPALYDNSNQLFTNTMSYNFANEN